MLLRVAVVIVVVCCLAAWSSWRTRKRLLLRMRSSWGRAIERDRDMKVISVFFRSRSDHPGALDDRTWNVLVLDEVFGHLDRTESTVGRQLLYDRLRSAP